MQGRRQFSEAASSLAKAVSLAEEMRQRVADRLTFFGVSAQGGRIRAYRALVATLAERALHGERVDPAFAAYGQSMAAYALYFAEATKASPCTRRRRLISCLQESLSYGKSRLTTVPRCEHPCAS